MPDVKLISVKYEAATCQYNAVERDTTDSLELTSVAVKQFASCNNSGWLVGGTWAADAAGTGRFEGFAASDTSFYGTTIDTTTRW